MVPACVRSSTCPVIAAPGRHRATRTGSVRKLQTLSTGALTTNDFEISIAIVSQSLKVFPNPLVLPSAFYPDTRVFHHPYTPASSGTSRSSDSRLCAGASRSMNGSAASMARAVGW